MSSRVLLDTGPLVAIGSRNDNRHAAAMEQVKALRQPLFTCWPVLTEAAYLLRQPPQQVANMLALTNQRVVEILLLTAADIPAINAILVRYHDQAFQLADASLMHLANRGQINEVFTYDRRDFSLYRTPAGKALTIVGE